MPVISQSALVAISALGPRYTALGLVLAMALGRYKKHDWWGYVQIFAGILGWHVIIMLGVGLRNPLTLYVGPDYYDANRILNIIYPVLMFFYCWIGFMFHKVLSNIQLLQVTEKVPYPLRSQSMPAMLMMPNGEYDVRNIVYDRNAPDRTFGIVGLTPSWGHQFITLVWIVGGLCAPQVVYEYFIPQTGKELMCFLVVVLVPAGSTCLYCGICYRWTDPGTFGLTKKWLEANNDQYKLSPEQITSINRATKMRVLWSTLPIAAFALVTYFLIAGWRYINPDADRMWLGAIGVWGLYAALLAGVCIIMRPDESPFVSMKTIKRVDDSQGMVEDMASPFQPFGSSLLSSFLGQPQQPQQSSSISLKRVNLNNKNNAYSHDDDLFS